MSLFRKKTRLRMALAKMTSKIQTEAELEYILNQAQPHLRNGIEGMMRPYLKIKPKEQREDSRAA